MHDAIVVGGGIAGLAAAWELRERDVVVLEAAERVGGRIRSERRGELWLNFGAHVFAGAGSATDRLLRETGVAAAEVPGVLTAVSLRGRLVAGGRVETYPLRLPLAPRERVALARTGLRLARAVRRYARVPQADVLAHLGDETFADWLGPVPDAVDAVLRATLRRSSAEPEQLAAGYGIGYFHLVWERSGGLARNILGGPSTLTEAIAAALGPRVRTGTAVEAVVEERGGSLMAYSGATLAEPLWHQGDEEVRARYLADLHAVLPGVRVAETVIHRWEHGLPYVRPGRHALQSILERTSGRVALAGDYLGSRYTDTAIASGLSAAARVR